MSTTVIFYDEERKVLICRLCKYAVAGEKRPLENHLQSKHLNVEFKERRAMLALGLGDALVPGHPDFIARRDAAESVGYCEWLAVYTAYGCTECGFLTVSEQSASDHTRTAGHEGYTEAQAQTLFPINPHRHLFRVETPTRRALDIKSQSFDDEWTDWTRQRSLELQAVPLNNPVVETSVFEKRCGWTRLFAGEKLGAIIDAIDGQRPRPSSGLESAITRSGDYFDACHQRAMLEHVPLVKQYFRSLGPEISSKPLNIVGSAALGNYKRVWSRFLRLCAYAMENPVPQFRLTAPQQESWKRLCAAGDDAGRAASFSQSILEQPITGDMFASPLYTFIALQSWDRVASSWRRPHQIRPATSALVYLLRIAGLDAAFPVDQPPAEPKKVAKAYAERYLWTEANAVFPLIIALKKFLKSISDFTASPSIVWLSDDRLMYRTSTIAVEDVRGMVRHLLARARAVANQHLLFRPVEASFAEYSPAGFKDDRQQADNGFNFTRMSGGTGKEAVLRMLARASGCAEGKIYTGLIERGVADCASALIMYKRQREQFLDYLCILFHVTSGLPARATELTSLKHSNTACGMRNVYIVNGTLFTVTEWSKTTGVTDKPRVIARAVPEEVARLYIAMLTEMLPFQSMLVMRADRPPADDVNAYIWWDIGQPWGTARVTQLLEIYTRDQLGDQPLGVSDWRNVAIALARKLMPGGLDAEPTLEDELRAHQAGHGIETEDRFYAVSSDSLASLNAEALARWEQVSRSWQHYVLDMTVSGGRATVSPHYEPPRKQADRDLDGVQEQLRNLTGEVDGLAERIGDLTEKIDGLAEKVDGLAAEQPTSAKKAAPTPPDEYTISAIFAALSSPAHAAPDELSSSPPPRPSPVAIPGYAEPSPRAPPPLFSDMEIEHPESTGGGLVPASQPSTPVARQFLREIFGKDAQWLSRKQQQMIESLASPDSLHVITMPTASGKTAALMFLAWLGWRNGAKTTVVIAPYRLLTEDLMARLRSAGIASLRFSHATKLRSNVVFATPEAAAGEPFREWILHLDGRGELAAVAVDECHLLLEEFRKEASDGTIQLLNRLSVPRVLLSATLPAHLRTELARRLGFPKTRSPGISTFTVPVYTPKVAHMVVPPPAGGELGAMRPALELWASRLRSRGRKMIVVVATKAALAVFANLPFSRVVQGDTPIKEQRETLRALHVGEASVLVGTTVIANGVHVPGVDLVVHPQGAFDAIQMWQAANRGGRDGGWALSLVVDDGRRSHKPGRSELDQANRTCYEDFARGQLCRRGCLESFFDGITSLRCHDVDAPCDVCLLARPDAYPDFRAWLNELDPRIGRGSSADGIWSPPWPELTSSRKRKADVLDDAPSIVELSDSSVVIPCSSSIVSSIEPPSWLSGVERQATFGRVTSPTGVPGGPGGAGGVGRQASPLPRGALRTRPLMGEELDAYIEGIRRLPGREIVRATFDYAARLFHNSCLKCALTRGVEERHDWTDCIWAPFVPRAEVEALTKGIRDQRLRKNKIHFFCMLPLSAHSESFVRWREPCGYEDLVSLTILTAQQAGMYRDRFTRYGLGQFCADERSAYHPVDTDEGRPRRCDPRLTQLLAGELPEARAYGGFVICMLWHEIIWSRIRIM